MKHFREQTLAAAIGVLIADKLAETLEGNRPDLIVPMPMFWLRRMIRGTSSPEIMAESVAQGTRVRTVSGLLRCRRKTKKQSMLTAAERRRNVRGAFSVSRGYDISGRHAILIDDIVTTGASAHEASKALRTAGAARITVATVARANAPG
jgi:ComF family protein